MQKLIDLTGKQFGRLTVIKRNGTYISPKKTSRSPRWLCICDCGREVNITGRDLKRGSTKSCGCLKAEIVKIASKTHGLEGTRIYQVWRAMKERCYLPTDKRYKNYGGRGIKVCDEWKDNFQAFYDWAITNGYKEELLPSGRNKWSIDRIDSDGNYEPSNCRWISLSENTKKSFLDRRKNYEKI